MIHANEGTIDSTHNVGAIAAGARTRGPLLLLSLVSIFGAKYLRRTW